MKRDWLMIFLRISVLAIFSILAIVVFSSFLPSKQANVQNQENLDKQIKKKLREATALSFQVVLSFDLIEKNPNLSEEQKNEVSKKTMPYLEKAISDLEESRSLLNQKKLNGALDKLDEVIDSVKKAQKEIDPYLIQESLDLKPSSS